MSSTNQDDESPSREEDSARGLGDRKRKADEEPGKPPAQKKTKSPWTQEEDEALLKAVASDRDRRDKSDESDDEEDWDEISKSVPGRTPVQCLRRYMKISRDKSAEESQVAVPAAAAAKKDSDEDDEGEGDEEAKSKADKKDVDPTIWAEDEVLLLQKLVEQYQDASPRWNEIAENFPNRTAIDCLSKWQTLSGPPVIKGKGSWTAEEDRILREKRQEYGRKWAKIAAHLPGRHGKQCRERFVNHLDPQLKKGEWTDNEEAILISAHQQHGNRWAMISKQLPGRSDNDVKNHWYSTIQRKFQQHGKEKLVTAAMQQVQMMQNTGALPSQQPPPPPPPGYSMGPYNQAMAQHVAPPYYAAPHYPQAPGASGAYYPQPPPPLGQGEAAAYAYPPGQPPPYPHHYHYPPPHLYSVRRSPGSHERGEGKEEAEQDDDDHHHQEQQSRIAKTPPRERRRQHPPAYPDDSPGGHASPERGHDEEEHGDDDKSKYEESAPL